MQESTRHRWLLPALFAAAVVAVAVSYSPIVQVTQPVEASTSLQVYGEYGAPTGYGQCSYGGTALAIGSLTLRASGFYNHCHPGILKGLCVRVYREPTPLIPGESQLTLVGQRCIPQHSGDSSQTLPAFNVGCQSGRTYRLTVTFFVGSDSPSKPNSPLSCL